MPVKSDQWSFRPTNLSEQLMAPGFAALSSASQPGGRVEDRSGAPQTESIPTESSKPAANTVSVSKVIGKVTDLPYLPVDGLLPPERESTGRDGRSLITNDGLCYVLRSSANEPLMTRSSVVEIMPSLKFGASTIHFGGGTNRQKASATMFGITRETTVPIIQCGDVLSPPNPQAETRWWLRPPTGFQRIGRGDLAAGGRLQRGVRARMDKPKFSGERDSSQALDARHATLHDDVVPKLLLDMGHMAEEYFGQLRLDSAETGRDAKWRMMMTPDVRQYTAKNRMAERTAKYLKKRQRFSINSTSRHKRKKAPVQVSRGGSWGGRLCCRIMGVSALRGWMGPPSRILGNLGMPRAIRIQPSQPDQKLVRNHWDAETTAPAWGLYAGRDLREKRRAKILVGGSEAVRNDVGRDGETLAAFFKGSGFHWGPREHFTVSAPVHPVTFLGVHFRSWRLRMGLQCPQLFWERKPASQTAKVEEDQACGGWDAPRKTHGDRHAHVIPPPCLAFASLAGMAGAVVVAIKPDGFSRAGSAQLQLTGAIVDEEPRVQDHVEQLYQLTRAIEGLGESGRAESEPFISCPRMMLWGCPDVLRLNNATVAADKMGPSSTTGFLMLVVRCQSTVRFIPEWGLPYMYMVPDEASFLRYNPLKSRVARKFLGVDTSHAALDSGRTLPPATAMLRQWLAKRNCDDTTF
ncbi:hypothetical protein SODALDRAFT_358089 [Sodiomyces alkalinus F11]|uniref:Uncharacterized protein n=1 Tax=Sodiomyces alkalinus (strain CBS 110278 / VKM F-3762 / F11) TaxID=1314773 RepID=A0A3N2PYT1_SODAK|nr:hypothetical protein SODALDRAFT_358089 [Sodiomyces alkalinus F11]ROT39680.1 hypothetical protein SODALDRAFT_358089 [Sodiomyces alkalinus F11]